MILKNRKPQKAGTLILLSAMAWATVPACAEIDLAGNWAPRMHQDWQERGPGPDVVSYLGLPLNEDGRAKALSYSASQLTLPERQCFYYPPQYVVIGPQGFKMWPEADPVTGRVVAWKIGAAIDRDVVTIWMDGRAHPSPNAPHYFSGFTTGVWEGDMLTAYTTHVKAGYLRRNGVPSSDEATVTLHIVRHADILTIQAIIEDPVYLTEPAVISRSWQLDPKTQMNETPAPCSPEAEVVRPEGLVPHLLPGKNPFTDEVTKMYHIPVEAVMGGADTMYPEYRKKLKDTYVAPAKCVRYCCGWGGTAAADNLKDCNTTGVPTPEQPAQPATGGTPSRK
jgi:hypothetical protein